MDIRCRTACSQSESLKTPAGLDALPGRNPIDLRFAELWDRRRLLQQVIPEDEVQGMDLPPDIRSSKYINRPSFSLPLMANNFRRFNARSDHESYLYDLGSS